MFLFVIGFQSPPCEDHQVARKSHCHLKPRLFSLGSHQGHCGLFLYSLNRPQRIEVSHSKLCHVIIQRSLTRSWEPALFHGNPYLPSCKHYNFLTWFQRCFGGIDPKCIFCFRKAQCSVVVFSPENKQLCPQVFSRTPPQLQLAVDSNADEVDQWSGFPPRKQVSVTGNS